MYARWSTQECWLQPPTIAANPRLFDKNIRILGEFSIHKIHKDSPRYTMQSVKETIVSKTAGVNKMSSL